MKVEVIESEIVLPSEETPKHRIWLSNLDIALAPLRHTPVIYVYRPNGDADFFNIETIKTALSRILVPFYPLAGRIDEGQDGRPEINCTGEGALFVVARSESGIGELGDFAPSPEMRKLLVPSVSADPPVMLLMVQVTFFAGGEVILGTAFHHIVADGAGTVSFIRAWSEMARGAAQLPVPLFLDRTLLRARSPSTVLFDHTEYKANADCLSSPVTTAHHPFATAILKLTKSQLDLLKCSNSNSSSSSKITTFQAVAAHLWRCACIARRLAPSQQTRIHFPVNARARLRPPLPDSYFGNAICRPSAAANAEEIVSGPLCSVAEKIRDTAARVDDEYVRSLIDFLEVEENGGPRMAPLTDLVVPSWLAMPIYDADFGWGRPEFVGDASMSGSGQMYVMRSPGDDGGICVVLAMETENIERFKKVFYEELEGTS